MGRFGNVSHRKPLMDRSFAACVRENGIALTRSWSRLTFSGSGIPCARSNEHGFVAMARELANIRSEKRNTS